MAQGPPMMLFGGGGAPAQIAGTGVAGAGAAGGAAAGGGQCGNECGAAGDGGANAGCGVGCGTDVDHTAVPGYVGRGGDLAPETTYKYVGPGRGNFGKTEVATAVFNWWWCSIPIVILWLLVGWYFYNQECWWSCVVPTRQYPPASCTFWGDPHFWTFDNQMHDMTKKLDAYPNGDFWMVRTKDVWIQGRYRPTTWLMTKMKNDRACTRAIAFGGPFMQGNKFIIEAFKKATTSTTEDGQITYNGQPVLTALGTSFTQGPVTAKYHTLGHSIDERRRSDQVKIVDVALPGPIHVQVNRWQEYLDGKITMKMTPDMQGHCGNGNGNANDDQMSTLDAQGAHAALQAGPNGGRVAPNELIFEPTTFIEQHNFPAVPEGTLDQKFA